jgi:beta-D-xylosidase 4
MRVNLLKEAAMIDLKPLASPMGLLAMSVVGVGLSRARSCDTSGGGTAYQGKYKSLGCYNDSSVSILSDAKVSTIAMTPQYCADFCGARGYAYGGIEFTT